MNLNLHSCICNQKWIFYDTLRLYSARLKTFWIDRFRDLKILTWLRRLGEWNKRNVWFISEPQDDFFCFIPPSLGAKYDLIYRKRYIDKTYLKTFTSNLRKLSRQKFHDYLACEVDVHCACMNKEINLKCTTTNAEMTLKCTTTKAKMNLKCTTTNAEINLKSTTTNAEIKLIQLLNNTFINKILRGGGTLDLAWL